MPQPKYRIKPTRKLEPGDVVKLPGYPQLGCVIRMNSEEGRGGNVAYQFFLGHEVQKEIDFNWDGYVQVQLHPSRW